jgi:hypothetical protein
MRFEIEKKAPIDDVSDSVVTAGILALRSFGPSSFASLTDEQGNYLQVAGGGVTCMLERRDASIGRQYRAYGEVPSKVFPDGTILMFGGGQLTLRSDEWLTARIVTDVFLAFLHGQRLPESVRWRDVTEAVSRQHT